jgi:hypothetical protein
MVAMGAGVGMRMHFFSLFILLLLPEDFVAGRNRKQSRMLRRRRFAMAYLFAKASGCGIAGPA